jgi:nucleoside-diphosphate-sugar epimerase
MQGVDTVFHLAALQGKWVPQDRYHRVNVIGTENVCRAALTAGVRRLVHVSSWTIYGMARGRSLDETAAPTPRRDPYWVTKAQADLLVQKLVARDRLPAAIIRPGTIFGVGDRLNFGRIADRIARGRGIVIGPGGNALPLIYVTDVVQGLLLCAERDRAEGQVFNISNDDPLTQGQFLDAIASELGVPPPRVHIPYPVAYSLAMLAERAAGLTGAEHPIVTRHGVTLYGTDNRHSIERARAELGFEPNVTIREGVHLASTWYARECVSTAPEPGAQEAAGVAS